MQVSAEKFTSTINLIRLRWKVGPTRLSKVLGVSRQTIHAWKLKGAPEMEHRKLEKFLQNGPGNRLGPKVDITPNSEFSIRLNLSVDIINPTDEVKAKVEKTIALLESIRRSWA